MADTLKRPVKRLEERPPPSPLRRDLSVLDLIDLEPTKMTPRDLEVADLDGDDEVGLAEYILYMLNEMERLRRQDIEPIIEEYKRLDVKTIGLLTSDGGNQASSIEPLKPFYRTIPTPSLDQKRNIIDYFPWRQTSSDLWKVITIFSIYFGAGTTCFYLARHHISGTKTNNILDALFFTLVLTTSLLDIETCLPMALLQFFSPPSFPSWVCVCVKIYSSYYHIMRQNRQKKELSFDKTCDK
ncbi:LOW QUALITY PROTEIN: hypothetical protein OSB04_001250 [Centaurea solstitialis]|uniref:Uncharacterized protein n=1 Tax=Centaurea solstitialis TaxID=347529 RepID=A0AA38TSG7_9ASTR|nr:LOW QUALITY PROTEIN: hypothetical protein OSB04_001250 [Centaurea solstitialis]